MKKMFKRILAAALAVTVAASMIPVTCAAETDEIIAAKNLTADRVYENVKKSPYAGSEWHVLGLARDGYEPDDQVLTDYYENLVTVVKEKKGILSNNRYTEYARTALAVKSIGRDPQNVGGYDLISKLEDNVKVENQGINGPIWALMAFDSIGYKSENRDEYIGYILDAPTRLPDGGWKLSASASGIDIDITCMAVQALAPYMDVDERAATAIDDAMNAVMNKQNEDGSFGEKNGCEATAQVIMALCAIGEKPDREIVESLLGFSDGKGGFVRDGEPNVMATEQAYMALLAYERLKEGKNHIFEMSDVTDADIKVPEKAVLSSVTVLSNERASVKWNKISSAKGYQVRYKVAGGSYKYYTTSSLSKTISGLTPYKTYDFSVRGYKYINGEKTYGSWSSSKNIKATFTKPKTPVISSLKSGSKGKVTVKWKKIDYAKGYQVGYRKGSGSYKYVTCTSLSKTVSKLKSKKKYSFRVRAYKTVNGKKKYGNWSKVKTIKVR